MAGLVLLLKDEKEVWKFVFINQIINFKSDYPDMRQLKITKQITGRESYSIEKYLQEIGKIHVLSPEEEADLAKKIRSGDRAAREKLV